VKIRPATLDDLGAIARAALMAKLWMPRVSARRSRASTSRCTWLCWIEM